jgi:polyhydroxybutyrate depolymerase
MLRFKSKLLTCVLHGLSLTIGLFAGLGDRSAYGKLLSGGNHVIALKYADRTRSAIVHVPARAAERRDLPVIINFHGGGGHGSNEQEYSLMDRLADHQIFIAVYPDGTGQFSKRLLTWNAGACCGYAAIHQIDDVGFVRILIDKLAEVMPIDRRRIYATGLSNGAMMAYRLAAEAGDLIAAVAPIAGGMVLPVIKSQRAIPVMHVHSLDDPRALYGGGLGPPFPFTKARVFHPNIDQMISRWARHDGCSAEPVIERQIESKETRQTAKRYVYTNCREGSEVVLWKLTGAGHVWPGGKQKVLQRILGPATEIIDANQEMWSFFQRFSLRS